MTGSKVFQVWSFEFPYRVFWTRINPGLVPFYIRDIWIAASHATFFRVELRGSQFVSSFDRSREILLDSQDYSSNTEILPFIQQHDIGHTTWANRDPDTTCKSFWKKSLCQYKNELSLLSAHQVPRLSRFCITLLCKVALLLLFIINFTV